MVRSPKQPDWLTKKIEQSRRAAKASVCPRCQAPVLVGPSDDDVYWMARVDPEPVDAFTEAVAVTSGRMSYDVLARRGESHLSSREAWHRRAAPKWPIVLDHQCREGHA